MRTLTSSAIPFLLLSVTLSKAAEPKSETLQAWDDYIGSVTASVVERNSGSKPFLWVDESLETRQRVQRGKLVITNLDPRKVPQGLIHHWVGVMFIPNVSLDQVMEVLNSYDRYSDIYKSLIKKTSVIKQAGVNVELNVLAVQRAFSVTAAVETDEAIQIASQPPTGYLSRQIPPAYRRSPITASAVSMFFPRISGPDTSGEH
ncbi:MAG: hypothetical protein WBQ94_26230 [Terracidiphilus sp.]